MFENPKIRILCVLEVRYLWWDKILKYIFSHVVQLYKENIW